MEKEQRNGFFWIIKVMLLGILSFLILLDGKGLLQNVKNLIHMVSPLGIGLVLALIWNVPMTKIEQYFFSMKYQRLSEKWIRRWAVFLTFLLFGGVLSGAVVLVIPKLREALHLLADSFLQENGWFSGEGMKKWIRQVPFGETLSQFIPDISQMQEWAKSRTADMAAQAVEGVKGAAGGLLDLGFGLVFAVYILLGKERLKKQLGYLLSVWLPYEKAERISHGLYICFRTFRGFVIGQFFEALILGTLCGGGMFLLRLPYAGTIGVLVGVTALIPIVGAFLGAGVGSILLFTVSPLKTLIFLIFLLVLQQAEGNIIYPKVVGAKIRIPPMWVLASVVVGGNLAGPLGMFLGVPVFSSFYALVKEETKRRELQKAAGERE